ncbi:hypothetical protein CSC94_21960 [Zhengella mangrovi]|uniref:YdbS-like PH domain-containing protein n=1 Tax=Zhengella mangrovi TaxID=1982044 RepID=A0A2G1QH57_9HYPH|nr:PH domain-containing protein [Zhengella mangrovi]PHP64855.1 hypothetical protein CSC94_21960 [Zhengella mangrovi]
MQGVNDNPREQGDRVRRAFAVSFAAHLLAALAVALLFLAGWAAMWLAGAGATPLARLALVGVFVVAPVLAAHGLLAALALRVQVLPYALIVEQGVTSPRRDTLSYGGIRDISRRTSLNGRLTGTASLVLDLHDGGRLVLSGLKHAGEARQVILEAMRKRQAGGAIRHEPAAPAEKRLTAGAA